MIIYIFYLEEFANNYPDHLESLEKEKYANMKKERDRLARISEDKKNSK